MAEAKFVTGSIMRHIVVMSATGAVGISALFFVDLLDMFFLSLLGEIELAAAVGYAGTISFFTTSVAIGLLIAMGANVSRSIGQKDRQLASEYFINTSVLAIAISVFVALLVWMFVPELLTLMGASGRTHELAASYLYILLPSLPVITLAMVFGSALRALGDAKTSMNSTLLGGGVNALLDPLFIFTFSMGIEGAAIASVLARFAVMFYAVYGVIFKHQLYCRFSWGTFKRDLGPIMAIAGPAIFTNIATPIGNAFVTKAMADFGDGAVAAWAVIGRLSPVLFGMIFSLSGAIGPIIGQNYGANEYHRVRQTLVDALKFNAIYIFAVSVLLLILHPWVIQIFKLSHQSAEIVRFFSIFIAITFVFNGALFIANAMFNNLGKPKWSMLFNVGKATIGTIPFVMLGGHYFAAEGILVGQAVGGFVFALLAVAAAFYLVNQIVNKQHREEVDEPSLSPATMSNSSFSSDRAQLAQNLEESDCDCLVTDKKNRLS